MVYMMLNELTVLLPSTKLLSEVFTLSTNISYYKRNLLFLINVNIIICNDEMTKLFDL
jgi:hypothetical protein